MTTSAYRPTKADLAAANGRTIPDVIAADLRVLFCGINPGLWSAATGHHFARPGNRFWPALHRSGFTPHQLLPAEQDQLLPLGYGITNVVERGSARAEELDRAELIDGGRLLHAKVARFRPSWLAILGVGAYRGAFGHPGAVVGPQPDPIANTQVWVLPNPSGLNASYQIDRLSLEFAQLRHAALYASGSAEPSV